MIRDEQILSFTRYAVGKHNYERAPLGKSLTGTDRNLVSDQPLSGYDSADPDGQFSNVHGQPVFFRAEIGAAQQAFSLRRPAPIC